MSGAEAGGSPYVGKGRSFFDPYKADETSYTSTKKHNSSDITAVVQHFAANEWIKDPANPNVNPPVLNDGIINPLIKAYDPAYDRTVVPGSNPWNLGPPNGFVTSADITSAVKSYDGNCPHL